MRLARPEVLLVAAILSGPALWKAFALGELSASTALTRFILAVLATAAALAIVRGLAAHYRLERARRPPVPQPPLQSIPQPPLQRRRTDARD